MSIKTIDELRKAYPNLIKQLENQILVKLGIIEGKEGDSFTEDVDKLTDEERQKIRAAAKRAAK